MTYSQKNILNFGIASVWFINGLICKVLNFAPRHEAIVAKILESAHSKTITIIIGVLETLLALWILAKLKPKLTALFQIIMVAVMNILEFILVPDLLLWGKLNIVFAFLFIVVIFYTNFKTKNHVVPIA